MIEYEPKCKCDYCLDEITNSQDHYKSKNYTSFIYPDSLTDSLIEHNVGPIPNNKYRHNHTNCRPFRNCHNGLRRPYHYCRENYHQANDIVSIGHDCQLSAYPNKSKIKEFDMHVDCLRKFIDEKKSKLSSLEDGVKLKKRQTCSIPFTLNNEVVNIFSFDLYTLKNSETNIVMEIFLNDYITHDRRLVCELMPDKYKNDKQVFDWGHHHPTRHNNRYYPVITPYGETIPIPLSSFLNNKMCNYCTHHRPTKNLTIVKPCGIKQIQKCIDSIKENMTIDINNKPPHLYIFDDFNDFLNSFTDIVISVLYEFIEATEEPTDDDPIITPDEEIAGHQCPTCGQNIAGNCPVCGNEWVDDESSESTDKTIDDINKEFENDEFFT